MKRLLILLILAGLAYGGYLYYRQSQHASTQAPAPLESRGQVVITEASDNLGNIAAVLGAQIQTVFDGGREALSDATGGQSDPVINKALTNMQNEVKDLPKETVAKVKYEFCKGIVSEYEETKND